jgi:hypothetical protein
MALTTIQTTGLATPAYYLDDISYAIDGSTNSFAPAFSGSIVTLTNPFNLVISINGTRQQAFTNYYNVVWNSYFLPAFKGYTIDVFGNIKFADCIPKGSQVIIEVLPLFSTTPTKIYPFAPADILLGY